MRERLGRLATMVAPRVGYRAGVADLDAPSDELFD